MIEYSIITSNGLTLNNQTYAMFNKDEIQDFSVGDTIKIAVSSMPTNLSTKTVPMICDGAKLDNNGQYWYAQHVKSIGLTFIIIGTILFLYVLWAFMMIYIIMKKNKSDGHYMGHVEVINELASTGIMCHNCGANAPHYNTYCPNCGRKLRKKKDDN